MSMAARYNIYCKIYDFESHEITNIVEMYENVATIVFFLIKTATIDILLSYAFSSCLWLPLSGKISFVYRC